MKLYHATYEDLIPSIERFGLGGSSSGYEWEDSKKGVVYLATDPEIAISYAETNDEVPEDWLDNIVVFEVDSDKLDSYKLNVDQNVQDNDGSTYEYHGIIPMRLLTPVESIDETTSKHPMTQDELENYCQDTLGGDWKTVMKTAWMKVISKPTPGEKYETVTRDENNGSWVETKNTAKEGDFLVQNAYGSNHEPDDDKDPSKWFLSDKKIMKNYQVDGEIKVGKSYAPNPIQRKGIKLTEPIVLLASWGEEMNGKDGDWLVKAGEGDIYRIDKTVFENTYEIC